MKWLGIAQNTDILVRIIVPVYNVEQYVHECLFSPAGFQRSQI